MASYHHIHVLISCISSIWHRGCCAARKYVRFLHQSDDVGCMASAGPLDVIDVDGTVLESCDRLVHKSRFVQGISVDLALDVMLFTDTTPRISTLLTN